MRVEWTDQARGELAEQIRFIAARNRDAARAQRAAIHDAVRRLRDFPRSGRPGSVEGTRELVVSPYVLVYEATGERVTILHCYHGRQDWQGER